MYLYSLIAIAVTCVSSLPGTKAYSHDDVVVTFLDLMPSPHTFCILYVVLLVRLVVVVCVGARDEHHNFNAKQYGILPLLTYVVHRTQNHPQKITKNHKESHVVMKKKKNKK